MKTYIVETCAVELETAGGRNTWNARDPRETVLETSDLDAARAEFAEIAGSLATTFADEARNRGGSRFMERTGYGVELNAYELEDEGCRFCECLDGAAYTYDDYRADESERDAAGDWRAEFENAAAALGEA